MTAQISRDLLQRLRALLKSEGHSTRVGLTVQDDAVLMRVPKSAATACARVRALGGERLVLELARGESVWIRRLGPVGMDRLLAALPSFLPWALVKLGQARCPACGQLRTLARESYLQEAAWQLTRAHPTGFPAGWHEARAREVAAYRAEQATRKRTTAAPTTLGRKPSMRESIALTGSSRPLSSSVPSSAGSAGPPGRGASHS